MKRYTSAKRPVCELGPSGFWVPEAADRWNSTTMLHIRWWRRRRSQGPSTIKDTLVHIQIVLTIWLIIILSMQLMATTMKTILPSCEVTILICRRKIAAAVVGKGAIRPTIKYKRRHRCRPLIVVIMWIIIIIIIHLIHHLEVMHGKVIYQLSFLPFWTFCFSFSGFYNL